MTTEAPDLSSERNASRKLAQIPPKDESVKSASIHKLLNEIVWDAYEKGEAGASFGYPTYKERIQVALESAILGIIGSQPIISKAAIGMYTEQLIRLQEWIDGK